MSLADRTTQQPDVVHGFPCSVAQLFSELEGEELAAFERIMYGRAGLRETTGRYRGWTERQVFEVVVAEGYKVAQSQINQHRGKHCRCYRRAA